MQDTHLEKVWSIDCSDQQVQSSLKISNTCANTTDSISVHLLKKKHFRDKALAKLNSCFASNE